MTLYPLPIENFNLFETDQNPTHACTCNENSYNKLFQSFFRIIIYIGYNPMINFRSCIPYVHPNISRSSTSRLNCLQKMFFYLQRSFFPVTYFTSFAWSCSINLAEKHPDILETTNAPIIIFQQLFSQMAFWFLALSYEPIPLLFSNCSKLADIFFAAAHNSSPVPHFYVTAHIQQPFHQMTTASWLLQSVLTTSLLAFIM